MFLRSIFQNNEFYKTNLFDIFYVLTIFDFYSKLKNGKKLTYDKIEKSLLKLNRNCKKLSELKIDQEMNNLFLFYIVTTLMIIKLIIRKLDSN